METHFYIQEMKTLSLIDTFEGYATAVNDWLLLLSYYSFKKHIVSFILSFCSFFTKLSLTIVYLVRSVIPMLKVAVQSESYLQ